MSNYEGDMKRYRMTYDIHTHTIFSHGKGTVEDNVKAALGKGLSTVGISDHGPGHIFYGIKRGNISLLRQEIERLKPLYPAIEILMGVEANIINPSGRLDVYGAGINDFDYILAGYHYGIIGENPVRAAGIHLFNLMAEKFRTGGKVLKRTNTELVIKALYTNKIKVLTHPGDKGPFDLPEIARACGDTGTMMEISTWHEAPDTDELRRLASADVRFIISSDAHSPHRVGTFVPGLKRAMAAGIDPERIDNVKEV
ncbi:PHP domain-containing protein [Bacillota bacterium]